MLTTAAFSSGDTLITAGATLLGVLIGAVLGALTDFRLAKRRELAEARAGARLLQANLREAASALAEVERYGYWYPQAPSIPTEAWEQYRGVLASVLDTPSWERVARTLLALRKVDEYLRRLVVDYHRDDDPVPVSEWLQREAGHVSEKLPGAYNALAELADSDPVTGLVPPAAPEG